MIRSRYIAPITAVLMAVCLIACGFIVYAANVFDTANVPEYQKMLFGDEVISIDIQVDQDEWQSLLDTAQSKEWISGDLIINGTRFSSVGIRTKGNSSLSQVAGSDSGRYSLQLGFNHYVKGQTCYGLDTLCINNLLGDATYMKDCLSYEIMKYIGVDTPLTNYANVTVNGENYGFCIMLERYDKAFLDRVYNTSAGQLYNVKIQTGKRENFENMRQEISNEFPNRQQEIDGGVQPGGMGRPGGGMGFGQSGGGSLVYTDDNISSYSSIFDNAVFGKNSDMDKQRVITAIESLNAGTDLEKYFDVDEILRYFAAHTVVVNLDSYTSNMQQNYFIYERDGKITILPWDYGLAFGGFQSGSASSVANFPIDTPVSGVTMEDRPLLNKLLEVDEYRERYHKYLQQIVEGYFENGMFEDTINNIDSKIGEFVKNDTSAFYTYEQYKTALSNLTELGRLRAESIKGQLNGSIPSTSSEQNVNSSLLVDASSVNLSALGSMMGGMGQGGWPGGQGGGFDRPGGQWNGPQEGVFDGPGGRMFNMELMRQAMPIIMEANGELTEEAKTTLLELGLTEEQIEMFSNMSNGRPGGNMGQNGFPNADRQNRDSTAPQGMNRPDQNGANNTNLAVPAGFNMGYVFLVCVSLLLLIGAIVFVAKPQKNIM